jgi:shikimate dehydrogenase
MTRACVVGWPVEHSRSPLIHGHWLRRYGIAGSYTAESVRSEELEGFLRSLGRRGFSGCNVTLPHKEAAFAVATERDSSAVAVGAANTLWLDAGRLYAANTDTYGFMTHLTQTVPDWASIDRPVAIFGAGGAARAIVQGFLEAGVAEILLFNRTRERAERLARAFGMRRGRIKVLNWAASDRTAAQACVVVNTTPLGMNGAGSLELDFKQFDSRTIVADTVYVPLDTALLRSARVHGLRTVDGLGMLLHQAVPGFEKWFGIRPEVTDDLRSLVTTDIEGR